MLNILPSSKGKKQQPLIQNFSISQSTAGLSAFTTTISGSDILTNFNQYIFAQEYYASEYASWNPGDNNASFYLSGSNITTAINANGLNVLLAPSNYPSSYQSIRLSSSNTDDDINGWVLGYQETTQKKRFLVAELQLGDMSSYYYNYAPYKDKTANTSNTKPTFSIYSFEVPISVTPSTSSITLIQNTTTLKCEEIPFVACNADGLNGWQESPWVYGIFCKSRFNGLNLDVSLNIPGSASDGGTIMFDWHFNSVDDPVLDGFLPNAGIINQSQQDSFWTDYTLSQIGGDVINLETQTIWRPKNGVLPLEFEDTTNPISDVIIPGHYAYDSENDLYIRVDPVTLVASIVSAPY